MSHYLSRGFAPCRRELGGVFFTDADTRNQGASVEHRHSGMPSAGIYSSAFLDSGQNRAGMTEG